MVNIVDGKGSDGVSDIRTSWGMFFNRGEDETISRIEERIGARVMLPTGNGEGIQVLRYAETQQYRPHYDYFFHAEGENNGGNRLVTVLMYLSDVEAGGETVFPNVKGETKGQAASRARGTLSSCAEQGVAVVPRRGDAVVFWSLRPDGTFDSGSLHSGCPVIKGTKWAATKWIHIGHFALGGERPVPLKQRVYHREAPEGCKDTHKLCQTWADADECHKNPSFMVGTVDQPGACLVACQRCDLVEQHTTA